LPRDAQKQRFVGLCAQSVVVYPCGFTGGEGVQRLEIQDAFRRTVGSNRSLSAKALVVTRISSWLNSSFHNSISFSKSVQKAKRPVLRTGRFAF
jgi:hypothetical protein